MVIESSTARERERLIARLRGSDEVAREAAVARLTLLGARAVASLLAVLEHDAAPDTRAAVLRVLEGIGDPRALDPARRLLAGPDAPPSVALAAVAVLRRLLASPRATDANRALDALVSVVLDGASHETVRLAALDALGDLPRGTLAALEPVLARDPNPRIRARAAGTARGAPRTDPAAAALEEAAAGRGPERPDALAALVRRTGGEAPIATLHRLVVTLRTREATRDASERAAWLVVRGVVHQALADRGSSVALYDLRETLAAAREPLPVAFLAALVRIGDASCLEPIASAFARAQPGAHDRWRAHLGSAFRDIVHRAGLTRRHAAVRRVLQRWPREAAELLAPRREAHAEPAVGKPGGREADRARAATPVGDPAARGDVARRTSRPPAAPRSAAAATGLGRAGPGPRRR